MTSNPTTLRGRQPLRMQLPINRHGTIIAWAADKDRKGTR